MNSFSMNQAIRMRFPQPANDGERLMQKQTIDALADCLVDVATRLQATNQTISFEDLRREAQTLRDYAETLSAVTEIFTR